MKLPILLVPLGVFTFYIIVPIFVWFFARNSKVGRLIVIIFAGLYGVLLLLGITTKIIFQEGFAIIDVDFSANWCDKTINISLVNIDKVDLFINIIMLIPVGLILVYFSKKSLINKFVFLLVIGFMIGVGLETLQFILPVYRSVQLSDVLLNTFSVIIGGVLGIFYDTIIFFIRKKNRGKIYEKAVFNKLDWWL